MPTEAELLRLAQGGDPDAFAALVRPHQARLRAAVAFYLPSGDDVLDVVQDALVDAFQHLDRVDPQRPVGPWLRTLCRNRARKWLRARAARGGVHAPVDEALLAAAEPAEDGPELDALRACVAQLPADRRQLLLRRLVESEPVQRLAQDLERSPAAVSQLLQRLKQALRTCVEQRLAEGGA